MAIQDILPKKVRHAINRLYFFFNVICRKVLDPVKLDDMENKVVIILCQLEMYFPPSFTWMYSVERYHIPTIILCHFA